MATMAQEREIRELGKLIEKKLKRIYGERMGFFINMTQFNQEGIADYVSNVSRQTAVEWMQETIVRFENAEVIPASPAGATEQ